jgi:hypothetical protein
MRVPLLLVHGGVGAKAMDEERHRAYVESLKRILEQAYPLLARGGSAVRAVVRAVGAVGKRSPVQRGFRIQDPERRQDPHERFADGRPPPTFFRARERGGSEESHSASQTPPDA